MYLPMCVYIYIYIYIYVCVCACVCVCVCVCIYICVCVCGLRSPAPGAPWFSFDSAVFVGCLRPLLG